MRVRPRSRVPRTPSSRSPRWRSPSRSLPGAFVTAAASGRIEVAVGNILGGIALQTVVIVVLDVFGKRKKSAPPITYRAASLVHVIEAIEVAAVLAVVVAGTQLPKQADLLRVTPQALLVVLLWIVGLLLVRRAGTHLPWHEDGSAPDTARHAGGFPQPLAVLDLGEVAGIAMFTLGWLGILIGLLLLRHRRHASAD